MKRILLILNIIIPIICFSQKQGNIWYFAGKNGIDFNLGTPYLLQNGQIPVSSNIEGCATISDSLGNLLFYATANNIWNKNHQIMQNGAGLLGGESSTQGVLIVPLPKSDSLFYVFTLGEFQNCFQSGLRYSIVDICSFDGLGSVDNLNKNILLLDSAGEKMASTFHSNGTDIWLVVHKYFSDAFYAYLITENGIEDTVISNIGSFHPADSTSNCAQAIGQMKISPNGSKLALVNGNPSSRNIEELFDFNNTTGIVSNTLNLQTAINFQFYGVSFSSDNSKLYVSKMTAPYEIYQYDLSSGNPSIIVASKTSIYNGGTPRTGLQLASNGKIYIVVSGTNSLDVITNPNLLGSACGYQTSGFNLINSLNWSLPSFIDNFFYKNGINNCKPMEIAEIKGFEKPQLYQNIPNPFGVTTEINYYIPKDNYAKTFIIFNDLYGKEIYKMEISELGYGKINAETQNLSVGVYTYSLEVDGLIIDTKKMIKK